MGRLQKEARIRLGDSATNSGEIDEGTDRALELLAKNSAERAALPLEEKVIGAFVRFAIKKEYSYKIEAGNSADFRDGLRWIQLELNLKGSRINNFCHVVNIQKGVLVNEPGTRHVHDSASGQELYREFIQYMKQEEQIELENGFEQGWASRKKYFGHEGSD